MFIITRACVALSFLFIVLSISTSDILDIADYSFYFDSFHYDLTTTKQAITINDVHFDIDLNNFILSIHVSNSKNNESILLNITDDNDWNEVNIISTANNYTKIYYEQYIAIEQALTWNEAQRHCKKYYFSNLAVFDNNHAVISKLCKMVSETNECWVHSQNNENDNDNDGLCELTTQSRTECKDERAFICEKSKLLYRSKYIGVGLKMDYEDAETYCLEKFGTNLAKYDEQYLEDALSACADGHCWIHNQDENECNVLNEDVSVDCFEEHYFLCNRFKENTGNDKRRLLDDEYIHHPMHSMIGMGMMNPMMNPMMGGMGMGMNPMMMGMMNPMSMMMGMGGVHHVYDLHKGNMKKWKKKMKSMLRMMKDMHLMNPMMSGMGMGMGGMYGMNPMMMGMHGGCHRHYGCGGHHGHNMQSCVYFGMNLVCNAMMMPMSMMYPPMMGGLMPMGSGLAMNNNGMNAANKKKKTMVVVHSNGIAPKVKTEIVDDKVAKKYKAKGQIHKRRMITDDDDDDKLQMFAYSFEESTMSVIRKCKILSTEYEICVNYNLDKMRFSMDVESVYKKVYRKNERNGLLKELMRDLYDDYGDIDHQHDIFANDNLVWFEPYKANLGYAMYRLHALLNSDWRSIGMEGFVHYFGQIQFVYDSSKVNEFCSGVLDGLPYKLCVDGRKKNVVLYFDKDVADWKNDGYLYPMKEIVDAEFENLFLKFDDDNDWNEIYAVRMEDDSQRIEKCAYLITTKVCIEKDFNVYKFSIKAQTAHKSN